MNLRYPLFALYLALTTLVPAQIQPQVNGNANQLAQIIAGQGITVSNAALTCPTGSSGEFNGTASNIGLGEGIILSTGDVLDAAPIGGVLGGEASTNKNAAGYNPLRNIARSNTFDACRLEFDLEATSSQLEFRYVFASEEYLTYVGTQFNDAFAFYISGPGIAGRQNIGLVPGSLDPVTINTINPGQNAQYYIDNPSEPTVEYNGFTKVLTATADVQPCNTYHLELAIADGGDGILDAAVMIERSSLISVGVDLSSVLVSGNLGNGRIYENCDSAIYTFELNNALISDYVFPVSISGTAQNGIDFRWLPDSVVIPAGATSTTVNIVPIADNLADAGETVEICILDPCTFQPLSCETVTIEELETTIPPEQFICFGDSVKLEATDNHHYKYSWSPASGLDCSDCSDPVAGPTTTTTYIVTVFDKTCSIRDSVKVNVAADALPDIPDTTACVGEKYEVDARTEGFNTYNWTPNTSGNPGGPSPVFETLDSAVTYTVTAENEYGCLLTGSFTLAVHPPVTIDWDVTDILCHGDSTGSIRVIPTTPTPIATYTWNAGTGNPLRNVPAGGYSLTITDVNGCTGMFDTTLTQPEEPLLVDAAQLQPSECGGNNGLAQANIRGGTLPYGVGNWSPAGGNGLISEPVVAGIYSFTVTDAHGCMASDTTRVKNDDSGMRNATIDHAGPFCTVSDDEQLTAAMPNGQWSGAGVDNNGVFSPAQAGNGNHTVIYTLDAGFCSDADTITLQVNASFDAAITPVSPLCELNSPVALQSVTPGGTWWGPGISDSTNRFDPALGGPGNHRVYHFIPGNCGDLDSASITVTPATVAQIATVPELCPTGVPHQLSATPSGGNWSGTGISGDRFDPASVGSGTFTIAYTPAESCRVPDTMHITVMDTLRLSGDQFQLLCNGDQNGVVTTAVTGGSEPYQYYWPGLSAQGPSASGLGKGSYKTIVFDGTGCKDSVVHVVSAPNALKLQQPTQVTDALCNSACDGIARLFPAGGTSTSGYGFQITPPTGNFDGSTGYSGLCAGNYLVTVTDDNGCQVSEPLTIGEPDAITIGKQITTAYCFRPNGSVVLNQILGGTAPYSFAWSNGSTQQDLLQVRPGNYTLTVTDDHQCSENFYFTVPNTGGPSVQTGYLPVTCFSGSDGKAGALVSGGSAPFQYQWVARGRTDSMLTDTAQGLSAGWYHVLVTDATRCRTLDSVEVTQPTQVQMAPITDSTLCDGQEFTHTLQANGGNPGPYLFTVNQIAVNRGIFSARDSGVYTAKAFDSQGCPSPEEKFELAYLAPLQIILSEPPALCPGDETTLTAEGSGGNGAYVFTWDYYFKGDTYDYSAGGPETEWIDLRLEDGCSNPVQAQVEIRFHPLPDVMPAIEPAEGCEPLDVLFSLENGDYSEIKWILGDGTVVQDLQTFPHTFGKHGAYSVRLDLVTADGCALSLYPAVVQVHNIPDGTIVQSPGQLNVVNREGRFHVNGSDNIADIDWTLLHIPGGDILLRSQSDVLRYTFAGDTARYGLIADITSEYGCRNRLYHRLKVHEKVLLFIPNSFTPNGDGVNDVFAAEWLGVPARGFEILIYNRWGELIYESHDPRFIWDGTYKGKKAAIGSYAWKVRYYNGVPGKTMLEGVVTVVR